MNKYVTNLTLPNGTNVLIKDSECRTNLSNEINRATKKETFLQEAINTETNRATAKETELQNLIETINNAQHPIGSIYMSMNSTSPDSLFGGTWEQLKDRFLLACGDKYNPGTTGGEAEHTLSIAEMPRHRHITVNPFILANDTEGDQIKFNDGTDATVSQSARNTDEVGGNQPHNNMPPYLAVYVWKRIA